MLRPGLYEDQRFSVIGRGEGPEREESFDREERTANPKGEVFPLRRSWLRYDVRLAARLEGLRKRSRSLNRESFLKCYSSGWGIEPRCTRATADTLFSLHSNCFLSTARFMTSVEEMRLD